MKYTLCMMIKEVLKIFTAAILCIATMACSNEEDGKYGIKFDPDCDMTPIFPAEGDTRMYGFKTADHWSIGVDQEWITVFPTSGTPQDKFFSVAVAPTQSIEPRHGKLTIYLSHGKQVVIPIEQQRLPYVENLGPSTYTIGAEGGTIDIDISINMEYLVSVPKTDVWLTAERTRVMQDGTIRVTVDRSSLDISRVSYLRILTPENRVIDSLPILQDAANRSYNEIVYTTSTDQIAQLDRLELFNNNVIAHIYDSRTDNCRLIFETAVRTIPAEAFKDQIDITSFTFPTSLYNIGSRAFEGCTGCKTFTLPTSITTLGGSIFSGCEGELVMKGTTPGCNTSNSDDKHWLHGSNFPKATLHGDVGKNSFSDYTPLRTLILGESVKNVQNNAFSGCENIEDVYISNIEQWYAIPFGTETSNPLHNHKARLWTNDTLVTEVRTTEATPTVCRYTFCNYELITSITIGDHTKSIGWGAFGNCNVEDIYLGTSIISMGASVFEGCTAKHMTINFNFPGHSFNVENAMHWFKGLHCPDITFGEDVTSIGDFALSCADVRRITISDSVEYIGQGAFAQCPELETATMGHGLKTLDQHALFQCPKLRNVTLHEGLETIESYAFNSCTALTEISIPATVTYIGEYTFSGCDNLTTIYMRGTTPPELGNNYVFDREQTDIVIYVPADALETYSTAPIWSRYQSMLRPYDAE